MDISSETAIALLESFGDQGVDFLTQRIKPTANQETWKAFVIDMITRAGPYREVADPDHRFLWQPSISIKLIPELLPGIFPGQPHADKCLQSIGVIIDWIEERISFWEEAKATDVDARREQLSLFKRAKDEAETLLRNRLKELGGCFQPYKEEEFLKALLQIRDLSPAVRSIVLHRCVNINPERMANLLTHRIKR